MFRKTFAFLFLFNIMNSFGQNDPYGTFDGKFSHGNFTTELQLEIRNSNGTDRVFFSSPDQNAYGIPAREVSIESDSVGFVLQSDFFRYEFAGVVKNDMLRIELRIDNQKFPFQLSRKTVMDQDPIKTEDISFRSGSNLLSGTIYYPEQNNGKALYIVTSSGNQDRSASRAEALFFARSGYVTFHIDKRGTGKSEGNWQEASIEELCADDLEAISYLADHNNLNFSNIGLIGSSQGAAKVPYLLSSLPELGFGILVSCPASTLLESDLNFWKNRTREHLSEEDLIRAETIQRSVFQCIAGDLSKETLKTVLEKVKNEPWMSQVWVPELDAVTVDKKLNYTPIPYFQDLTQPLLVIQGSADEIIPSQSLKIIQDRTEKNNTKSKYLWIEKADHAMMFTGKSDFPYWPSIHPDYRRSVSEWLERLHP